MFLKELANVILKRF